MPDPQAHVIPGQWPHARNTAVKRPRDWECDGTCKDSERLRGERSAAQRREKNARYEARKYKREAVVVDAERTQIKQVLDELSRETTALRRDMELRKNRERQANERAGRLERKNFALEKELEEAKKRVETAEVAAAAAAAASVCAPPPPPPPDMPTKARQLEIRFELIDMANRPHLSRVARQKKADLEREYLLNIAALHGVEDPLGFIDEP